MFPFVRNILILLVLQVTSYSQSFRYTQYTADDGLTNNNVYAATQDDNGCIWFATSLGISKYDGYRFKNYNKKNGIATKAITDIVYAGGDSCIFIAYPNTLQSIHSDGTINTLVVDKKYSLGQIIRHGNIFFFYQRNKPEIFKWENGTVTTINIDSITNQKTILLRSVASLGTKGIALCTNKGLFILQGNSLKSKLLQEDIYFALLKKNGQLLVASDKAIYESNQDLNFTNKGEVILKGDEFVYHMIEDESNKIWLRGMVKGIYQYDDKKLVDVSELLNLKNQSVHEFFVDKQKNIWLCTDGSGVLNQSFWNARNYTNQDGLINNNVLQIQKIKSTYFIGTVNGISKLDGLDMKPVQLPMNRVGLQYVYKLFSVKGELGMCISNTFESNQSATQGFRKINMNGFSFYFTEAITTFNEDDEYCWIANKDGISLMKNARKEKDYDLKPFGIRKTYSIIKFQGKIYLGTSDGLIIIDKEKLSLINNIDDNVLGEVMHFMIDQKNRLWIATENGLYYLTNNVYKKVPNGPTFESNYCKYITEDDKGLIWCATWDGFFKTDGKTRQNYSANVGIASKICNVIVFDSSEKKLLVGTDRGLSILSMSQILNEVAGSKVVVECRFKDSFDVKNLSTLNSDQNNLNFYFNIAHFQNDAIIQYQYKLDNKDWITIVNPTINLSNLSGGSHKIQVRALLNNEIVSKEDTIFNFTISEKFYKRWWFILVSAIVLQYIIYRIIKKRNAKVTNKKLAEKTRQIEYASLKQQAFSSLMNPHFIFNALNSVQHYVNKQDRLNANRYLSDFAKLIRRSFDAAQRSFVPLEEELETIRLYVQLEQMRFADKFDYTLEIDENLDEDNWVLPSMVLQPYVENAILHGLMPSAIKGVLKISIKEKNKNLIITIIDNGIGIQQSQLLKANQKHTSKGMQLIKERLEILSKLCGEEVSLSIETAYPQQQNCGTKVTLAIPEQLFDLYWKGQQINVK